MNSINKNQHGELVCILQELIKTISLMQETETDYLLIQNASEAKEWLDFLNKHFDKEVLKTLENEVSDRFFFKFDVQIGNSELDNRRAELMKQYISKSNVILKE